jgi:hypothetical protein
VPSPDRDGGQCRADAQQQQTDRERRGRGEAESDRVDQVGQIEALAYGCG